MTSTPTVGKLVPELRIGVSQCLLGAPVRYDTGHKRDDFLVDTLGPFVTYVPVCPEVEAGMSTPREAVRLICEGDLVKMVGGRSGTDWTAPMAKLSERRARELEAMDLSGYVFKKDSPSCGVWRVRLYRPTGADGETIPTKDGRGLFAEAVMRRMPLLPVEEEGRLRDLALRENFIERVFAYRRMRVLFDKRWSRGDLVSFHTAEKLLLLAHHRPGYEALGRLVAQAKVIPRDELATSYQRIFTETLAKVPKPGRHADAMLHVVGFFKQTMDPRDRADLLEQIEDYRRGLLPLIVPITLVRHHVNRSDAEWLKLQTYLAPSPKELMLLNHV